MSDPITPMPDKPRLQLIDGGQEDLARKCLKLIISPDSATHEAEIDRLMAILKRRAALSSVWIKQDGPLLQTPNHTSASEEQ